MAGAGGLFFSTLLEVCRGVSAWPPPPMRAESEAWARTGIALMSERAACV